MGTVNDRSLDIADDGTFTLVLSPDPHDGAWIKLEPDAVCAITRDYLADPERGARATWPSRRVDPPSTRREDDADLARRLRATLTWVRDQAQIVPIPLGTPNTVDEPYPVPSETFGWAAGDAAYAMGILRAGRGRGAGHRGPVAALRLLERLPVEPIPPHLRLRLRAGDAQRRPRSPTRTTARGGWWSPHGTPATPTGSRRPATRGAGSGSAGSSPRARRSGPPPGWSASMRAPNRPPVRTGPGSRGQRIVTGRPAPVVLDDLAHPRFSPEIEQLRASRWPTWHRGARSSPTPCAGPPSSRPALDDFGDDCVPCTASTCSAAPCVEEGDLSASGRRQLVQPAAPVPEEPAPHPGPAGPPPRDPRDPHRAADHHLRSAPHRHHPSAQPDRRRPRAAVPALLGEPRAGAGRTPSDSRPG